MFEPGEQRRIEQYEILGEIGRGGMGVVYLAVDHKLNRKVAIKRVQNQGNLELRRHLVHEARAMAQLSHPNVVSVYEIREADHMTFIVMEYVDGVTLNVWLGQAARSMDDILSVFRAAGAGVAAAHSRGLVHRDFKPTNVMIGADRRVRVMDFGLACPDPGQDSTLVGESAASRRGSVGSKVAGTPAYMAPEQSRGRWTDARSDQFSFCVALYEALYGERPFLGTREQVWAAAERGEIRPAPRHTTVPTWLRQVVVRGLQPDPTSRFESMQALLDALDANRQHVIGPPSGSVPNGGGRRLWSQRRLSRRSPVRTRRRRAIYVAAIGFLGISTMATFIVQPLCRPEGCVFQIEGDDEISKAWIVLEDGGEVEVEVEDMRLRFNCDHQNELATVIAAFEDVGTKYWSTLTLSGDDTLRLSDATPGRPAGLSLAFQRELDGFAPSPTDGSGGDGDGDGDGDPHGDGDPNGDGDGDPHGDGDSESCTDGTLDCPCYGNDTCNPSLECIDGICAAAGAAQCSSGETASRPCGNCGEAVRTCRANGTWGKWGDCAGVGACSPGERRACGKKHDTCKQGHNVCSSTCTWGTSCIGAACIDFAEKTVASDFHCGTNIFETSICQHDIEAHCPVGSVATGKCTAPVNLSGKGNCFFESLPERGTAVTRARIRMEIGAGHGMDCRVEQCFCRYQTP
jgi:predicted Ser/Thr protein kinase